MFAPGDCDTHPVADCSANSTCRTEEEQEEIAALVSAAPALAQALSILAGPPENGAAQTSVEDDNPVVIRCQLGDLRRAWAALAQAAKL